MVRHEEDERRLKALARIVRSASGRGPSSLTDEELVALPRLYRFASSLFAQLETAGVDGAVRKELRVLLAQAHSVLYRKKATDPTKWLGRCWHFLSAECARAIRAEWKLVLAGVMFFYGISVGSYFLVRDDLGLAYTLFDPGAVNAEIQQIEATAPEDVFRGNFTFGLEKSSFISGWILAHNIQISVLFFSSGLVPPLFAYLLSTNALMLGTYTGVASHWGRATEISSILWCHGVLEIQAIILAGIAGLVLLRAWIAPGPRTRRYAMRLESRQAWKLFAPVFPILFTAGMIEGFVSPHAPTEVRIAVAIGTGCLLLTWILFGGRRSLPA